MRRSTVVGLFSTLLVMATLTAPQPALAGHITLKITPHGKDAQVLGEGLRLYSDFAHLKNQASISQRGNSNAAAIGQHGTGDAAAIFQNGKGNAGTITQNGNNDGFALFQFGKNNGGSYTQNGNGQVGIVLQAGW
jgi:major curlin subunit